VASKIAGGELASSEIGNMYTASIFMSLLSLLSNSYNKNETITDNTIGFIAYGSGSKSKVFEGVIQKNWASKIAPIQLFQNLENRTSIEVNTYENLHQTKLDAPILNGSKISMDYVESDETNYGLRRYSMK
ncbi:hydroxymethylglutaryl-CoA synthase, partial [Winogradskyella sp.]|nr:hydroxymethylglutaryl-CoA synthase [Winogradskyella sp.]